MMAMKLFSISRTILFLAVGLGNLTPLAAQNLLNAPECTTYDQEHHRYLVSCYGSGAIVQIDSTGQQSYFKSPSGNLLSNTICGNTLYVSAINSVKAFDLDSGDEIWNLVIPGSHQLDGMTCDNSGFLYVADFQYSGSNDQIYKISLVDRIWSVFVAPGHGLCESPQDIIYDPDSNRLLVACYYNAPIQAIDLADSAVSTVVVPPIGNFDGIARDNYGNYYLTSWTTNAVHRYGPDFSNPPEMLKNGLLGPANLCFNPVDNELAIPEFDGDSVVIIPVFPVLVQVKEKGNLEVFPNPCHGKFQVRLNSTDNGEVLVYLFSPEGKMIYMEKDRKADKVFTMNINVEDLSVSVFILNVMIGSNVYRKLIVK